MVGIGVIGFGYWGPNLLRNFDQSARARVVGVADLSADRLKAAGEAPASLMLTQDPAELIDSPEVDAVAIATPLSTHFDLTLAALRAGKHVLVEKPLCGSSGEAAILIEEAERRRLTLMVDHTFLYTGAVRKAKELVSDGSLGDLYYYDSVRVNLGLFRHDVNVVWDLACHDFSIIDHLFGLKPAEVSAVGVDHVGSGVEDSAHITVFFDGAFTAHVGVNWLAPVKVRTCLVAGSKKMIVYDELATSEKVKVYDKGVTLNGPADAEAMRRMLIDYRTGDMQAPRLDRTEALQRVTEEFLDSIAESRPALSDGAAGLRVIRVLEAATASMAKRGAPVEVQW